MDAILKTVLMLVVRPILRKYAEGKISSDQVIALLKALFDKFITKENVDKAIDSALDYLEKLAEETPTKIDDDILKEIRALTGVKDNDQK